MEDDTQLRGEHGLIHHAWMVEEYPVYQRSWVWYTLAALIGAGLIVYALATVNFLFALIILMFGVVVAVSASRNPVRLRVALTEDGLELGHRFVPWTDLARFWVAYNPPEVKTLYLDFKNTLRPDLAIGLHDLNPTLVRRTMLRYLEEDLKRDDEPLTDYLGRLLKI